MLTLCCARMWPPWWRRHRFLIFLCVKIGFVFAGQWCVPGGQGEVSFAKVASHLYGRIAGRLARGQNFLKHTVAKYSRLPALPLMGRHVRQKQILSVLLGLWWVPGRQGELSSARMASHLYGRMVGPLSQCKEMFS